MPLPRALDALTRTRRFWTDYLWETEPDEPDDGDATPYPQLDDFAVDLLLPSGRGLRLSLDSLLCYHELALVDGEGDPVVIAFDDQAHWHPHAIRWDELDTFCRALALTDRTLHHPGPTLLLLHRFAPICEGDDVDWIVPALEAAWQGLGLSPAEIQALVERGDARDAHFRWRRDDSGRSWPEQVDDDRVSRALYGLRHPDGEFPFARWAGLMREAEQIVASVRGVGTEEAQVVVRSGQPTKVSTLVKRLRGLGRSDVAHALDARPGVARARWVLEAILGLSRGALSRESSRAAPRAPRTKHSVQLDLPLRDTSRALPESAGRILAGALGRMLGDASLGGAEVSGSMSSTGTDGSRVAEEQSIAVGVKGDLDWGLRLVRQTLWWLGAPTSVRVHKAWTEDLPLDLSCPPTDRGAIWLELCRLETAHFEAGSGHRFDRVPLEKKTLKALRAQLSRVGATGPDAEGWFTASLPDGAVVRVCLRRADEDAELDGATIVVTAPTERASLLVHDLLTTDSGLLLLPPALAASHDAGLCVEAPWPKVRVVSAEDLFRILGAGPHAWWASRGSS